MCFTYSQLEAQKTGENIIDLNSFQKNVFFLFASVNNITNNTKGESS